MRPNIRPLMEPARRLSAMMFLTSYLLMTSGAQAQGAEASKIPFIKAVRVMSASLAEGTISYQLACGETLRGLVLKESRESLALGIIVDRTDKICSSLPAAITTKIALKSPLRLRSLVTGDDKRVLLGSVSDVVVSRTGLGVSWQDTCRPMVGIVLSALDGRFNQQISVQTAQLHDSGAGKANSCEGGVRRASIKSVDFSGQRFYLPAKPGRLSDLYLTRVVAPEKVTVTPSGVMTVAWRKHCMEKPLGLLFAGPSGREVGVVSMIAPNASCRSRGQRQHHKQLHHYHLPGLVLPSSTGGALSAMTKDQAAEVTEALSRDTMYLPITELKLSRRGQGDKLYATSSASCSEASGLVLGIDVYGNLAAALLAKNASPICHVSQKMSKIRAEAPLVVPESGPAPRIFSLKVFGTLAN